MKNSFSLTKGKGKTQYNLTINGSTAVWEHCELDYLIQTLDNNIGLKPKN